MKRAIFGCGWMVCLLFTLAPTDGASAEGFIDAGGVRLRFTDEGTGTPVVFLHGFAESFQAGWVESGVATAVQSAGFRFIAFDQRGLGGSEKPQLQSFYGIQMVRDVIRLMDHLEIRQAHVVGYSMGAAVALKLLTQHPDRVLSATLSGYGTPPLPETMSRELEDEIRRNLVLMKLESTNDVRALALISLGWREWLVDDVRLGMNAIRSLILIGEADVFLKHSEDLATTLNASKLVKVSGDHGSARGNPAYHQALIRFLLGRK